MVCYDILTEARLDVNWNSRRIWMLLLRVEEYLRIVRVNIVTSLKRAGFEHCVQTVTFSSSTTELPLWLWLYYPGGSTACTPTRVELAVPVWYLLWLYIISWFWVYLPTTTQNLNGAYLGLMNSILGHPKHAGQVNITSGHIYLPHWPAMAIQAPVWHQYFFCIFILYVSNGCVIERYGWELSTVQRWASNSQYWQTFGDLNF